MARPVTLSVNVDLKLAEAKLRAFEIRTARAVNFGTRGRPSFVVGSAAFLPPTVGSSTVGKGSPISRVQFTSPAPNDQTIRSLGMLGAMDLVSGRRLAGANENISRLRAEGKEYLSEIRAAQARGLNPGAMRAMGVGLANRDARLTAAIAAAGATTPAVEVKPKAPKAAATKAAVQGKGKSMSVGMIRSGAEVAGLGRFTARATAAGFALASFGFLRKMSDTRNEMLRDAAESGDPESFNYSAVVDASAQQVIDGASGIWDDARALSVNVALSAFEAYANVGLGVGNFLRLVLSGDESEDSARISRQLSQDVGSAIAAASGETLRRQATRKAADNAWVRSYDDTLTKAAEFSDKIARARADQALSIGFNFGTRTEIENLIKNDIADIVRENAINEYLAAKPHPSGLDMTGKKD